MEDVNLVTKSKKNLYFVEESSKMILTTGKVRKKLGETLSHGVPLIVNRFVWHSA